jgi:hypothetical protein
MCAGVLVAHTLGWMAKSRPEDVTLFTFEDGAIEHQRVHQVAAAAGADSEPVQIWPRAWRDEHGRLRLLRPFEACDLLLPLCRGELRDRLARRSAWVHEILDRAYMLRLASSLDESPETCPRTGVAL